MTDPRKPVQSCPHCDWKAYSVMGAFGYAAHMEEAHGIIIRAPMEPAGRY